MEKRERHTICMLLMVWLALLVAALPIFSGSSVAVAGNADWTETVLDDVYNILDIEALDVDTA
jgi:hypothetical protein